MPRAAGCGRAWSRLWCWISPWVSCCGAFDRNSCSRGRQVLFHKKSPESEMRILTWVGIATILCVAVVSIVAFASPFGGRGDDHINVVIESPYAGRGVKEGTAVLMHGVEV